MNSSILLLARNGSSRLPRKLLRKVLGRPILEYQIERLRRAKSINQIVLCTTPLPEDDELVECARACGIEGFRGSADDVVERMAQAARHFHVDVVVSIGGDDVLSDPVCTDTIVERLVQSGADFAYCEGLPVGASPYGVTTAALERLLRTKTGGSDGWERYFQEGTMFGVERIHSDNIRLCRPELRMTLDYAEDFEFFKLTFEALYPGKPDFSLQDVIELGDQRPDIRQLGQARAQEWLNKWSAFDVTVEPKSSSA